MKYWVFSDSRILGPYSREELSGIDAVHAGTLVCQEGTTGVQDGDWRALEAVPELAGLAMAAAPAGYGGPPYSETLASDDMPAAAWPPPFEDDPRFNFWMREEVGATRNAELEISLRQMREQMARHERRQDEILDRLNAKDSLLQDREREIADLRARLTLFETGAVPVARSVPAAATASEAALPRDSAPETPAKAAPPVQKVAPPAARPPQAAPPAAKLEPAPEPVVEAPSKESPARAAARAARARPPMEVVMPPAESPALDPEPLSGPPEPSFGVEAPPLESSFGIPESESLSPVSDVPPPLEFAVPGLEEAVEAPPLEAPPGYLDPAAPPPMPQFVDPAFASQPQPQQPGSMHTPQTTIFPQQGGLALTPGSVPLGSGGPLPFGGTPEPIPLGDPGAMTPMPTMGQPDLPQTVMQGLGVAGQATPFPFGQQTPLPRLPGQETTGFDAALTAPRPMESPTPGQPPLVPPTGATKPTVAARVKEAFRSKKFLIILGVAVVLLGLILGFFLRDPKKLAKTVDIGPEQKTAGSFNVDTGGTPDGSPQAPQASPFQKRGDSSGAEPAAAEPAPPPAAPAPKGRDYVSDQRVEAMEFVKNYRLDESRGTIGAWLQYSFLGPETTPEWSAGAIEKDIWFVQYNVFKGAPGGRGRKPTYSFRFEVDLGKRSLKGSNPSAQEMLNTGRPRAKPTRRPAKRRRAGSQQQPLPGDEELDGSSGGADAFNNPGG
ncbi:MAG: hypothetical protein HYZ75_12530 [Elusimicrobia bacterium]|nr:hypothetical protein [Elusimicrobiota bacterium]